MVGVGGDTLIERRDSRLSARRDSTPQRDKWNSWTDFIMFVFAYLLAVCRRA